MTDGWEYYSAKDLNVKAVPYPGKRPFPNALDPSDGARGPARSNIDFDGDGLTDARGVPRLARTPAARSTPSKAGGLDLESPLGYSDGTKFSRASETPGVPAWRGPAYGLPAPPSRSRRPTTCTATAPGATTSATPTATGSQLLESARGPSTNGWWDGF